MTRLPTTLVKDLKSHSLIGKWIPRRKEFLRFEHNSAMTLQAFGRLFEAISWTVIPDETTLDLQPEEVFWLWKKRLKELGSREVSEMFNIFIEDLQRLKEIGELKPTPRNIRPTSHELVFLGTRAVADMQQGIRRKGMEAIMVQEKRRIVSKQAAEKGVIGRKQTSVLRRRARLPKRNLVVVQWVSSGVWKRVSPKQLLARNFSPYNIQFWLWLKTEGGLVHWAALPINPIREGKPGIRLFTTSAKTPYVLPDTRTRGKTKSIVALNLTLLESIMNRKPIKWNDLSPSYKRAYGAIVLVMQERKSRTFKFKWVLEKYPVVAHRLGEMRSMGIIVRHPKGNMRRGMWTIKPIVDKPLMVPKDIGAIIDLSVTRHPRHGNVPYKNPLTGRWVS